TRDITERKRAAEERARLEEQIRQAQKLESLGVLAGGIAHDFNNLLMAIMGNLELIGGCLPEDSSGQKYLTSAQKAAQRAAELCSQMLAYAGRGPMSRKLLQPSRLLEELRPMLEMAVAKPARLVLDIPLELPPVEADQAQLQQALMNLVTNASEALLGQAGEIRIRAWSELCGADRLQQGVLKEHLSEGPYVFLSVSDTGCGMDETLMPRVFDPFFTTKFAGRGLGLPAVLGIVRSHRGTMTLQSQPGVGTTVTILLPVSEATDETAKSQERKRWKGTGTILLVDDEASVREVTTLLLTRLGFRTRTAVEGAEALQLIELSEPSEFPVCVILDVTMPGMDGIEAHRRIKARWPALPVIISSGYQAQDCLTHFHDPPPSGFLKKPYSLSQLEALLRSILR
ncbi:MAG TPA: response regulator, partial [Candidatus Ozemobacteraceae bacterium]|nr:response regulator [Candidatus Ozemobacteraceae bacterium]